MTDRTTPLQNRVTPEGDIVAVPARGLMMGNRGGALHDGAQRLGKRRWVSRQWICCRLDFHGRHREVMAPGRYTELFFLDEATAFAAGHRPCFECRHADAMRFAALWPHRRQGRTRATAADMDGVLHDERVTREGGKRVWQAPLADLPPGTMTRIGADVMLVAARGLLRWTHTGYSATDRIATGGPVDVLTPPGIVAVLGAGYDPMLHPSATGP